tara:strand:+ start:3792 stop:4934 length:1143 start_codon:yes stop_codon:yes gene_type:complete
MNTINIHDHVSFDDEPWLIYQVDKINFYSGDEKDTAYCWSDKGRFSIYISDDLLCKDNKYKLELIKHELGHGMFGHLSFNVGKSEQQRKLFNIVADCSIHVNLADGKYLGGLTYENTNLPQLPPELLYDKLNKELSKLEQYISNTLPNNEKLWQHSAPKIETQIIQANIEQGLEEAKKAGAVPSSSFCAGGTQHSTIDIDYDFLIQPEKMAEWLDELLRVVRNFDNQERERTYRREHRNPVCDTILSKGYGNTPAKPKLLFAVDCSGSMDREVVDKALGQLICHVPDSEVLLFDTKITDVYKLKDKAGILSSIKKFWGGTNLKPVLDYVSPHDSLIVFTDGGLSSFKLDVSKHNLIHFVLTDDWYKRELSKLGKVILVNN